MHKVLTYSKLTIINLINEVMGATKTVYIKSVIEIDNKLYQLTKQRFVGNLEQAKTEKKKIVNEYPDCKVYRVYCYINIYKPILNK